MKLTKKKAKNNLSKLIKKFERELATGRVYDYNEEATKISFIQPLLQDVLGWNVRDHDEVSPEERISRGRVDYGLKIKDVTKIFIEAKPVRADLNKHIEQAVKYGYNKKSVPFVLLTDFEGLKLFDVTVKPDSKNLLKGLKIDLLWNQYLKQFDKLWLFSKDSVIKGELDDLLLVKPKHRIPVDKAILEDLKRWRVNLAKDIFKNNQTLFHSGDPDKDANYLKEINQKILDRIIFMRSCEDRGLVQRRSLKELFEERTETVGTSTMVFLRDEFKYYNEIFDSDLFRPQEWENDLSIDFKIMRDIILDTYNPYQFDVIPLEVLGNIYEQYLGYTIRLTDHQVKYELKPQVRKAGGVYYTPEYIVDYIVNNTIGKSLQEFSPRKIKKLRILDPACGSGSFLIRAYEEMLNYYRSGKKKKSKPRERQRKLKLKYYQATPPLTIHEKSKILREHIFGVDIDEQAVEVTKLSLMLKMLEGEYGKVIGRAVLPMLDRNIQCGNSLISGDILELKEYFGEEWYKVKPFNWTEEFRKIMVEERGFDVVIGNPPYGSEFPVSEKKYLQKKYIAFLKNNNSYTVFFLIASELSKNQGFLGLITPTTFLTGDNFVKLRETLISQNICQIIKLPYDVFADAYIDTCITIVRKQRFKSAVLAANIQPKIQIRTAHEIESFIKSIDKSQWLQQDNYNFIINNDVLVIRRRILANKLYKLGEICQIDRGTLPPKISCYRQVNDKDVFYWFEGQIYRYVFQEKTTQRVNCDDLREFKSTGMFKGERILLRQLISRKFRVNATFVNKSFAFKKNLYCIYNLKSDMNLKYILAIINSILFSYYIYNSISGMQKDDFPSLSLADARNLPIRKINFVNKHDREFHDNLVVLVDVMLDLNKKIQTAKGSKKSQLQRQIEKIDREIDEIVYKLYGITKNERKLIEKTDRN